MRFTERAIARALRGFAAVALLTTIALLAVAPAHPFNFPPMGCGAPGAWYFHGLPDLIVDKANFIPTGSTPLPLPPTCRAIVNHRFRLAGIAGSGTVGLLAAAGLVTRRRRNATPTLLSQYG